MSLISRLDSRSPGFQASLEALIACDAGFDEQVQGRVSAILKAIQQRGDEALIEYTREFDGLDVSSAQQLELPVTRMQEALNGIPHDQRKALQLAAQRIRDYAERQRLESWEYTEPDGTVLGQQVTPLDKVGLYAPGGKAAYPSSVLMNAIPAKVAGVSELVMASPTPKGVVNDLVLAAAAIAGVDRFFTIGGAQAIGALAYGTQTVPAVDKIVGPGNVYVAAAKRQVFGAVGIDMIAGPSEILVICDGNTDPDWIVMDLFSQAEHDEDAQSILLCPDAEYLDRITSRIQALLDEMPRKSILETSLRNRAALIRVKSLDEAVEIANHIAPEHLELSVERPELMVSQIRHAGAIFMGRYSAEALGDYCAGPNHVLPTARTARFSSPLGVYDFQKRSSLIYCSREGASRLGATASVLARGEGFVAHARSAEARLLPVDNS